MATVTVLRDDAELADTVAERLTTLLEEGLLLRQKTRLCLTGGRTPRLMYERLADPAASWRRRIDWSRVELFWGDERHVPPDHGESNYGMAEQALLRHVEIPPPNIHRIPGEVPDPQEAARAYETRLPARFDVMLLGLGADAHVASIFPGSPLLAPTGNRGTRVAAVWAPHLAAWRLTLTATTLLEADHILVLVSGRRKALAVRAALEGPLHITRFPAQILRHGGERVEWFVDIEAASTLERLR